MYRAIAVAVVALTAVVAVVLVSRGDNTGGTGTAVFEVETHISDLVLVQLVVR